MEGWARDKHLRCSRYTKRHNKPSNSWSCCWIEAAAVHTWVVAVADSIEAAVDSRSPAEGRNLVVGHTLVEGRSPAGPDDPNHGPAGHQWADEMPLKSHYCSMKGALQ